MPPVLSKRCSKPWDSTRRLCGPDPAPAHPTQMMENTGMTSERLTIETLGAQGDGVARTARGPLFVPFALPGEVVTVEVSGQRGKLLSVDQPSPLRVEPKSPHFGTCGGCSIQHLASEAYAQWKRDKVVRAFETAGLNADIDALVPCAAA